MSTIYNKTSNYPPVKVDANSYEIQSFMTVTAELAHNPVKAALSAFGSVNNADLLWLVNHIKNPFKELTKNRILKVPSLVRASSKTTQTSVVKTTTVKNVTIDGQKLIY